jgi:hypothetical protein
VARWAAGLPEPLRHPVQRLIARLAVPAPAALGEPFGWALGALLFPVERALVRRLRESPSTELMVCRRRS